MDSSRSFNSSSDSWLSNYEACDVLGNEIMQTLATRNQQQKHSRGYVEANMKAKQLIKKFSEDREKLIEKLFASQSDLLEGEFERRERMLDRLWTKKLQIDEICNPRDESSERNNELFAAGRSSQLVDIWGVAETDETRDLGIDELKQRQLQVIDEQDKSLGTLHEVVVRQKKMAQNIGQELDLHNEIIEDITDHADRTRERLIRETRHVTIVDRTSDSCWYWVVIVLLFIAIVTVALV